MSNYSLPSLTSPWAKRSGLPDLSKNLFTSPNAKNLFTDLGKSSSSPSSLFGGSSADGGGVESDIKDFGSFFGPTGALISTAVGGIARFFSESPEQIAKRRIDAYTGQLEQQRKTEVHDVSQQISQGTAASMAQAANIAGRQAAALGKTEQTESFALPATSRIAVQGGRNLKQAVTGINSAYNTRIAEANASMLGVPATEGIGDVIGNLSDVYTQASQQEDFFSRLEKIMQARNQRLGYA